MWARSEERLLIVGLEFETIEEEGEGQPLFKGVGHRHVSNLV
jgi:hypothetical protein